MACALTRVHLVSRVLALGISVLTAAPALASSVDRLVALTGDAPSVTVYHCTACPPSVDRRSLSYVVPDLPAGTERTELRKVHGELKIVRAEAWLGGSAVTFVSKASDQAIRMARATGALPRDTLHAEADMNATTPSDGPASEIDRDMTTAALTQASATAVAPPSASREIDEHSFELRLD
jgi:hypothetical protein